MEETLERNPVAQEADDGEKGWKSGHAELVSRLTFEDHVRRLTCNDAQASMRADDFLSIATPFVDWLEHEPRVRRLGKLRHLGLLRDREGRFFPHTRLDHSRLVAANAVTLGLLHGASNADLLKRLFGAMLHDIGHSCYSHNLDYVLSRDFGLPDHEARGQEFLSVYTPLRGILHGAGIRGEEVIAVMREEGAAGACQSVADTLAYVELDSLFFGRDLPKGFAFSTLRSVLGVELREGHHCLKVDSPYALLYLLNRRAELFREWYRGEFARLHHGAMRVVFHWAFKNHKIEPREVANALTDDELDALLALYCLAAEAPAHVRSAYKVMMGDLSELAKSWTAYRFEHRSDAAHFAAERDARTGHFAGNYLTVLPVDIASKRFDVVDAHRRLRSLKATLPVPVEHRRYIHYVFRG